jgi:hypothetical protein
MEGVGSTMRRAGVPFSVVRFAWRVTALFLTALSLVGLTP